MGNGCFTKHPFRIDCLGYQETSWWPFIRPLTKGIYCSYEFSYGTPIGTQKNLVVGWTTNLKKYAQVKFYIISPNIQGAKFQTYLKFHHLVRSLSLDKTQEIMQAQGDNVKWKMWIYPWGSTVNRKFLPPKHQPLYGLYGGIWGKNFLGNKLFGYSSKGTHSFLLANGEVPRAAFKLVEWDSNEEGCEGP